jgi:hypothetical protein
MTSHAGKRPVSLDRPDPGEHPVPFATRARRAVLTCALIGALGVGIGACGSASSSSATAVAGTGAPSSSARYQARLNLAKCFRAHGINVPDPSPNGGVAGGGGVFRQLRNYSRAQVTTATQACRQYLTQAFPNANLTPAQQAQFRQAFVKYAECMRSHGINIPDPTTTGGGGFGLRGALANVDRNSPAFKSANTACASLRPRFGRGGGGPPAGAPGA